MLQESWIFTKYYYYWSKLIANVLPLTVKPDILINQPVHFIVTILPPVYFRTSELFKAIIWSMNPSSFLILIDSQNKIMTEHPLISLLSELHPLRKTVRFKVICLPWKYLLSGSSVQATDCVERGKMHLHLIPFCKNETRVYGCGHLVHLILIGYRDCTVLIMVFSRSISAPPIHTLDQSHVSLSSQSLQFIPFK